MKSKLVQEIITSSSFNNIDIESILGFNLTEFIDDLKSNEEYLNSMEIAEYAFDCYSTNRFMGTESEKILEEKANELAQNGTFFAGLVFLHEQPKIVTNGANWYDMVPPPTHLQYKIRMGHDSVPSSNELKSK